MPAWSGLNAQMPRAAIHASHAPNATTTAAMAAKTCGHLRQNATLRSNDSASGSASTSRSSFTYRSTAYPRSPFHSACATMRAFFGFTFRANTTNGSAAIFRAVQLYMSPAVRTAIRGRRGMKR